MKNYKYTMVIKDGNGDNWSTDGTATCEWLDVTHEATHSAMRQLMKDGHCTGPYEVTHFTVERSKQT